MNDGDQKVVHKAEHIGKWKEMTRGWNPFWWCPMSVPKRLLGMDCGGHSLCHTRCDARSIRSCLAPWGQTRAVMKTKIKQQINNKSQKIQNIYSLFQPSSPGCFLRNNDFTCQVEAHPKIETNPCEPVAEPSTSPVRPQRHQSRSCRRFKRRWPFSA